MNKLLLGLLILFAFVSATTAIAADVVAPNEAPPTKRITNCQKCHGPSGDSVSEAVPRLNGQQASYIIERLNNFLDPTREDPHATKSMWGVVSGINNTTLARLRRIIPARHPRNRPAAEHWRTREGEFT